MFGSVLIFLFLTLIFFTRAGQPDWIHFQLPKAFTFSTVSIILSSFSLSLANKSYKSEQYKETFNWLVITLLLGISFCLLQVAGWMKLNAGQVHIFEISGSFVYLFSGLHFLHILLGVIGLAWVCVDAFRNRRYVDGFIQSLNPAKVTRLQIVTLFWHFLDILWVALYALLWTHQ